MVKRKDEEHIMHVLIQLAEEENTYREYGGHAWQNESNGCRQAASAQVRTTLSEERTQLVREQTKFSEKGSSSQGETDQPGGQKDRFVRDS